jgi:hypothetical protein
MAREPGAFWHLRSPVRYYVYVGLLKTVCVHGFIDDESTTYVYVSSCLGKHEARCGSVSVNTPAIILKFVLHGTLYYG